MIEGLGFVLAICLFARKDVQGTSALLNMEIRGI